jgi:hypothetical protein
MPLVSDTDQSVDGDNHALNVSSVSWFSFPVINCRFQGVNTAPVPNNGTISGFQSTFDVSPPQTLIAARCSRSG